MSLFTGFLKANLAKEIGRLHDWRETFWGRRYHSASIKETEHDQIRRFLYILDNSCKEGLVASPLEWPGVVFYIESRRFLIRDSPRPATTYEQKTGGADGVKGA